ncbi:IQ motif, EF-hand binding site [Artemisia annua]|uniref:IQ motif, EF-hand binding site n=2 Tax=Anthemideae TaxID=102810 RepID=A0A2U1QA42_ARTAN|nr:IQ motif, EF-hand binding site [Artemisia annua]
MDSKHQIPSSPLLLRDISNNFKTPKPKKPNPNNSFQFESPCPTFFSALKQTPKSSSCTTVRRNKARFSLAAQKVRAVELEQTKSSRKAQNDKEKALKSLAKSLTVWLNFLLENPRSCGVEISRFTGEDSPDGSSKVFLGEKRDSTGHGGVEVDREWRGPKRRKDELWIHKGEVENKFSSTMYSRLKNSLGDICSLDDMKERMATYLSLTTCKEILDVMTHVTKNIDEGRLKMKAHCPIVTDVGMKENALKILMSYNPVWLRIGLYIVFGGESLLPKPNTDTSSEQDASFLKMVAEKLFFSHAALAKAYIYNKLVDGLYRPGYYEKLGSVILKKFLLLALILDRAKSQSSLPICYGIDGIDGGSPLLFTSRARIKSSSEMISGFLSSDVMHGVGNLITHLTIIGYKVSYQQNPLVKYVFKVTDLFNDLKDGVLLCRAIQLLQHDPSVLKKVVIASDDRKKNMANCEIALKYLKQSGVPLHDEDGTEIITEDIVNGDKELVISLLWNMFVHLQLPLLINNKLVTDEITNIRGPEAILPNTSSQLEMLLEWIKAICDNYDLKVENLASLVDGKAMWCLLDYYFRKELCNDTSNKETNEVSIMSASDYVDAVHNFLLSQKLTTLLGNFPEVLQVSDILEYKGACSDRGVIILLVFLSSQLVVKRNLQQINFHKLLGHNQTSERKCVRRDRNLENHDEALHVEETCQNRNEDNGRKFKAIMEWWKEMALNNSKANEKPVYAALQSFPCKQYSDDQRGNAAKIIQSHFRRLVEHRNYTRTKKAVSFLQCTIRNFIAQRQQTDAAILIQTCYRSWILRKRFLNQKQAAVKVQTCYLSWILRKRFSNQKQAAVKVQAFYRSWILRESFLNQKQAAIQIQACYHSRILRKRFLNQKQAAVKVQACYRTWILRKSFLNQKQAAIQIQACYHSRILRKNFLTQKQATIKIQSLYRGWALRKGFLNEKQAAIKLQSIYRGWVLRKRFLNKKQAVIKIQSHYRGWLSRSCFLKQKQAVMRLQRFYWSMKCLRNFRRNKLEFNSAMVIQSHTRGWIARRVTCRRRCQIVQIQSVFRGWLMRREFLLQKEATAKIQSAFRRFTCLKAFNSRKDAAIVIQRYVRGCITRKKLLVTRCLQEGEISGCNHDAQTRTKSAIVIQTNVRRWIAKRKTVQRRHRIAVIQSYWKGYIERKHSREKVSDIRLRVQQAAANVDDGQRIINRLITALAELKNMKSVSGILHTCATLDMATKHSQKCCEELVAAGAIGTLLKLIDSISRSIADQEVLKHTFSTFRNLTRHPHLTEALIETNGSSQAILLEFIRNKEETYFIAADVLQNICSHKKGVERLRGLPSLVKRLHNNVENLKKKAANDKRNPRTPATKEQIDRSRRLKEAVNILKLITQ